MCPDRAPFDPRRTLCRNTSMAALRQAVTFATYLVVTPVLVHGLGLQRFGIWTLVVGLTSYAGLMDLGLRAAVMKFVAEFDARRDRQGLGALVGNGLLAYGTLGLAAGAIFFCGGGLVLDLLRIPAPLRPEAAALVRVAALQAAVSMWLLFAAGYVEGLQSMSFSNLIFSGNALLAATGTYMVVRAGASLQWLAAVQTGCGLLSLVALVAYARRETRRRHGVLPVRLDRRAMRDSLRYGSAVLGSSVAHLGNLHFDKLLLGRYVGLEAAGIYDLALRVALGLRLVPVLLLSAVVPVVSHLSAMERTAEVRRLYHRAMRYVAGASMPLAAFAVICMPSLLRLWLGKMTPEMVIAAQVLAVAHLGNTLLGVPLFLARGLGTMRFEMRTATVHVGLQVALGCALIPVFGLRGALVAATVTLLGVTACGLVWTHRGLHLLAEPAGSFFGHHLRAPLAASALAAAATLVLGAAFAGARGPSVAALLVTAVVFTVTYFASLGILGDIEPDERAVLARAFRR